jgi:hypothetical protein
VWIDSATFAAVGLHYAGEADPSPNKERAWAKSMTQVTEKLGVIVFDGAAISTCTVGGFATVKGPDASRSTVLVEVELPQRTAE